MLIMKHLAWGWAGATGGRERRERRGKMRYRTVCLSRNLPLRRKGREMKDRSWRARRKVRRKEKGGRRKKERQ